jgi:hypothetical protein
MQQQPAAQAPSHQSSLDNFVIDHRFAIFRYVPGTLVNKPQYLHGDPQNIISESLMNRASGLLPKLSFFLGGAVLGLFLWSRKTEVRSIRAQARADAESVRELRQLLSNLQAGLARQESLSADLLKQLQDRLEELSSRVGETPSTQEIVTAVERLLFRTMTSLDERLSAQAQSIELLKSTISQTDSLLERVLESIDSLEVEGESAVVISQPATENPPS